MCTVTRAVPEDSGNYTCTPSSGHQASVTVHVLDGELESIRLIAVSSI